MGIGIAGSQRGILCEANVVPLIDILLVLLVIFMIIPHRQMGLQADLPHQASLPVVVAPAETIVVQILSDGSLRINRLLVKREELRDRLERIFAPAPAALLFFKLMVLSSFKRLLKFWMECMPQALPRSAC